MTGRKYLAYFARKKEKTMEKFCLECGAPLGAGGRSDRKFCSQECKNLWHNSRNGSYRNFRQKILSYLDRNHQILENLLRIGIRSVDRNEIISLGFSPCHMTSFTKYRTHVKYFCYDICYHISESRIWGIEKHSKLYEKSGPPKGEPPVI